MTAPGDAPEASGPIRAARARPTPIVELGVDEAHALLSGRFGVIGLPPLEAIENEDWGRDLLLGRFLELPPEALAEAGLTLDDADAEDDDSALPGHPGGDARRA